MTVVKRGLVEEIEQIYETRYTAYCRLATTVTGSVEMGHEAVQEAFARALARKDRFRGEGTLEAWLWRIVLRSALDLRRGGQLESVHFDEVAETALLWTPELPHPERDRELDLALRGLSARQRLVVFLRYFADMTHREIAAVTGMQLGTVSATLNQARGRLARRLGQTKLAEKEMPR